MNIALCFSGQIRDFSLTRIGLIKYVLSSLNSETLFLFSHFPSDNHAFPFSGLGIPPERIIIEQEDESSLSSPEKTHDNAVIDVRSWHQGDSFRRFYLQLRSIHRAYSLCSDFSQRHGIEFTWVFRLRFDNLYFGDRLEDIRYLDPSAIYIPEHDNWSGLNDRFAFGGPAAMEAYCKRFELFSEYQSQGYPMHPEEFLAWTLIQTGTPVMRTRVTLHLLRYGHLWPATYISSKGDGPVPKGRWWFKFWRRLRRTRFAPFSDHAYLMIIRLEMLCFQLLQQWPLTKEAQPL